MLNCGKCGKDIDVMNGGHLFKSNFKESEFWCIDCYLAEPNKTPFYPDWRKRERQELLYGTSEKAVEVAK